ncbi:hypothetical protein F4808DRAFT_476059 [Astrocystis sublimbata]|nr:hypothetical protein F4808DRAFT_476059 [Astrocystis sublimbata]
MAADHSELENGELLLKHHDDFGSESENVKQTGTHEHSAVVRPKKHSLSFLLAWKGDILSWFGSFVFFGAIIGILLYADGKYVWQLQFPITPNAIIGLLSTFAQVLLLKPVNSAIGQVKWLLLLQERPIDDLRAVDAASRGAYGGVQLLISRKGGWIGSAGAAIAIVALSMHTLFQEALHYDAVFINTTDATINTARYINGTGNMFLSDSHYSRIDPEVNSAPYIGLYSPVQTDFDAPVQCSSGNCTWEPYETLGVCNNCQNVTNRLQVSTDDNGTARYSLPNGFSLRQTNGLMNITTSMDSVAFPNNGTVFLNVLAIGLAPGTIPIQNQPIATECLLQFCIQTKRASFVNGILHDTVISSWTNESQLLSDAGAFSGPMALRSPQTGTDFVAPFHAWLSLQIWLYPLFEVDATWDNQSVSVYDEQDNAVRAYAFTPTFSTPISQAIYEAMNTSSNGFQYKMDNFANILSQSFRTIKYQPPPTRGFAFTPDRQARVVWQWLILPIFELFASLVLLVAVIIETRRRGMVPWGNNALAYIFHGLDERPTGREHDESQVDMKQMARDMRVQFQPRKDGGHLVLSSHLSK